MAFVTNVDLFVLNEYFLLIHSKQEYNHFKQIEE